jgi:carboxypeptidase C (cathepsin A)
MRPILLCTIPGICLCKVPYGYRKLGGTYAPNATSIFHKRNKELDLAPVYGLLRINLTSVILANGMTDPLNQFPTVPEFACNGPYPYMTIRMVLNELH